jgi:CheY-like chemotaxis protein
MGETAPTILLVEDDSIVRELLRKFLERSHFTVLQAEDGAEGLVIAREQHPQAIVCDNVMPKMTGVEMFRALRGSTETQSIPVVFSTAFAKPCEEIARGDRNTRVLQKPFLLSELVHAVQFFTGVSPQAAPV